MVGAWWQRNKHLEELGKLNNELAKSQQLIKETQTAYSSRAIELENLKAENKDLQKVIKAKKEEVLAVTDLALQWKDKYFKIKDAKESVVDSSGSQPVSLPSECETCVAKYRFKVEFDSTRENLRVFGQTLTNPAEAEVNIAWLAPLRLQLVLTKSDDGSFRVYVDSKDQSFVPTELSLKVDPSILGRKWFERINFTAGVSFGHTLIGTPTQWGGLVSLGAGYMVTHNFSVGLNVSAVYTNNLYMFYGANLVWFPFMRKQ